MKGWTCLTHLIFFGLTVSPDGKCELLGKTDVWLPLLDQLRAQNQYLKVLVTFPQHISKQLSREWDSNDFWETLCARASRFDGCVLSIEGARQLPASFCDKCRFVNRLSTIWVTISNIAGAYPDSFVTELDAVCDYVMMNSYGYVRKSFAREVQDISPFMESAMADFTEAIGHYTVNKRKIVMGIDTCGVRFSPTTDTQRVHLEMVPLGEIDRLKAVGMKIGERNYRFHENYDQSKQGCLLKLANGRAVISFDNYRVRRMKIALATKMAGVCVGELVYDMHPMHPRSLLNMAYSRCASGVRGLNDDRNFSLLKSSQ